MKPDGPRLFVFNHYRQFIRTVTVLPRDEIDMDDVDTGGREPRGRRQGFALGTEGEEQVPQPFLPSLFLRNNEFWNHDRLFESEVRRDLLLAAIDGFPEFSVNAVNQIRPQYKPCIPVS